MFKYSFIAGTLGQVGDRYLRTGYKTQVLSLPEIIDRMASYGVVSGVEIHHRGTETEEDTKKLLEATEKNNLKVSCVNAWLYGQIKWANGSFTARDLATRKEAIAVAKASIDYARKLKTNRFNLWLGQDGFDYVFQTDYNAQWRYMKEALQILADYAPDMKICIEPKSCEPRNHLLIDTVSTALLICMEANRNNLGLTVDLGHVLYSGQSMAQALSLAIEYGKLFNVHVNDNYGRWDDDMAAGSVHFLEPVEAIYVLKKYNYQDFIAVDIFPYREEQFEAVYESIKYVQAYDSLIDKIGMGKIDELIREGQPTKMLKVFREVLFG